MKVPFRLILALHRVVPTGVAVAATAAAMPFLRLLSEWTHAPVPRMLELVAAPTILGSLIGEAVTSPMAQIERTTPRNCRLTTGWLIVGYTGIAAAAITAGFGIDSVDPTFRSLLRNLTGQTGAALVSAALWQGHRAFILPLVLGLGSVTIAGAGGQPSVGWMIAPDGTSPAVIAAALMACGLIAALTKAPITR